MAETLHFEKLASSPTDSSWAQAYNAGKLCAVLALKKPETDEETSLSSVGKEILTTLEQEFFTLEEKNLESVKKAVQITTGKIPEEIFATFLVGAIIKNVLYIYIKGHGQVKILRDKTLQTIASHTENELASYSGFLQNNDIVVFTTAEFTKLVSDETLEKALAKPFAESVEDLGPLLHETEVEDAAAVLLQYTETQDEEEDVLPPLPPVASVNDENLADDVLLGSESKKPRFTLPKISKPHFKFGRRQMIFFLIVGILLFILGRSIFLSVKNQNDKKLQAEFDSVFPQAQKKYQEAQDLLSLNKNLSIDSFLALKKMLDTDKAMFSADSPEGKQIADLEKKVELGLSGAGPTSQITAKDVPIAQNLLLQTEKNNTDGIAFTQDGTNVYFVTAKSIMSADKKTNKTKAIIPNNSDWSSPVGIGAYLGSIYVLDKKAGIIKYVVGSDGYGKTTYFTKGTNPDMSKSISLSIDGSLYVLFSNGSIAKFTKGAATDFSVKNVDKSLSGSIKILTGIDDANLYVLDKGNSRVVVLSKDGGYVTQYGSSVIKTATDFDVDEKNKKIFILNDGKLSEIDTQ